MSDITLSAGIRQNLLSLQQTSRDLTTTQEALATGKSVNSAAD
ncbi:MAG: flagellar protein, partial [Xanthobacteraceae bacterium]